MDFEFLYSTDADTVEVGDVIRNEEDVLHVDGVDDKGDRIFLTGVSEITGEREDWYLHPSATVDILGN